MPKKPIPCNHGPNEDECEICDAYDCGYIAACKSGEKLRSTDWVAELEAELRAAESERDQSLKANDGNEWHKLDVQAHHLKQALRVVRSRSATNRTHTRRE